MQYPEGTACPIASGRDCENTKIKLTSDEKDVIRRYMYKTVLPIGSVVVGLATLLGGLVGYGAKSMAKSEAMNLFAGEMTKMAIDAGKASGAADEAIAAIQRAKETANESAKEAALSAGAAKKNEDLVTGAAEIIANKMVSGTEGEEFRNKLASMFGQDLSSLKSQQDLLRERVRNAFGMVPGIIGHLENASDDYFTGHTDLKNDHESKKLALKDAVAKLGGSE